MFSNCKLLAIFCYNTIPLSSTRRPNKSYVGAAKKLGTVPLARSWKSGGYKTMIFAKNVTEIYFHTSTRRNNSQPQ